MQKSSPIFVPSQKGDEVDEDLSILYYEEDLHDWDVYELWDHYPEDDDWEGQQDDDWRDIEYEEDV